MTPWSHLPRKLTNEEWIALKEWLIVNPDKRSHLGDKREDGKLFYAYSSRAKGGERQITPEALQKLYERTKKNSDQKWADPAFREKENLRVRERRANDTEFRERERQAKNRSAANNPETRLANRMRYLVRKRDLIHPDLDKGIERTIYLTAVEISNATGAPHHVDHIIPLCSGGWHHQDNLQILPANVNIDKGMNAFWTSAEYLDWKDVPVSLWPSGLAPVYSGLLGRDLLWKQP